jgi:zinc protease
VEEVVRKGLEPVSQTVLTFTGPFDYANQSERVGIRALASALQTRLFDRVREELGGSYGAQVSAVTAWRPEGEYVLTIRFGSDPGRVDELLGTVFEEIEDFREVGPAESELADAKEAMLRQHETDLETNGIWLGQIVADYQREVPPGVALETYGGAISALTVSGVRDMAARILDPENYIRVTLLPE